MGSGILEMIIIGLVIFIVIFIVFREINCWYWKINENIGIQRQQLSAMRQQIELLEKLVAAQTSQLPSAADSTAPAFTTAPKCPSCGADTSAGDKFCMSCGAKIL